MSMKLLFSTAFCCLLVSSAFCQNDSPTPEKGYYVIVGAFAVPANALAFRQQVTADGMEANYGYVPSRKLYYVYLAMDKSVSACLDRVKTVKTNPKYSDAWVRYINEEATALAEPVPATPPATTQVAAVVETTPPVQEVQPEPEEEEEPQPAIQVLPPSEVTLGNTEVFLSLYNEQNDRVVGGKVQVVDTERGRLIQEVDGNTYLTLPDPKSKSGQITLICNSFGYRRVLHSLSFSQPLNDSTRTFIDEMGTSLVVKFGLTRYRKGDINALYNVYFYNDAAVFLPESKFELNELLVMMKENPSFKIRLHGHSNGNYHGKIIKVGPSGNFFSVAEDSRTAMGSAKELSEARAEVIKDYLVANGIEATRMEIKAWGGKRPIYDRKSANAKRNIRVEVEILSE